ncbi:Hint domain-containing protein [Ruegeria profundi]|uniref:Hint domain-containing protein n=1 Tax=Ruegeria profundi TaxID=1685378 RepID=UPI001CD35941|nr:Hint domain-containing protein [Ruegeria profundi]MCA0927677.1 Hint domain-containing protein [Ruegeria profundi]
MARYSIFILGESQLSVSVPQGLDGLNQGTGVHLIGETITIDSRSATEVFIRDNGNDNRFADNDGNQRLDGDQTIDGVLFNDGTRVEAEYGITLTDGTNTWQAVAFNVNNSNLSYATVEGIAFIGGPGDFPPAGVKLTVVDTQEGPSFQAADYVTPICYDRGTWIRTDQGRIRIEKLKPGDKVWTQDSGYVPVRWVGMQNVIATGRFKMVEIPCGTLSNFAPLLVSQQHRLLITHAMAELHFGSSEVFAPAISFVDAGAAWLSDKKTACYHHLLLDQHAVIKANGAASESLLSSPASCAANPDSLFFSDLAGFASAATKTARLALTRREAVFLIREILAIEQAPRLIHTSA